MSRRGRPAKLPAKRKGYLRFLRDATPEDRSRSSWHGDKCGVYRVYECAFAGPACTGETVLPTTALTLGQRSCGCLARKRAGERLRRIARRKRPAQAARLRIDMTDNTCGPFAVLRLARPEEIKKQKPNQAYWYVRCGLCAGFFVKSRARLRHKPRCTCQASRIEVAFHKPAKPSAYLEPIRVATVEERAQSGKRCSTAYGAYWLYACKVGGPGCVGNDGVVLLRKAVESGETKSCGCLRRKVASERARGLIANGQLFKKRRTAVIIGEPGSRPVINGQEVRPLSKAQYDVVRAVLAARAIGGLSKDELVRESRRGDAVKTFKSLATKPDWASVMIPAGKKGGRYRIL